MEAAEGNQSVRYSVYNLDGVTSAAFVAKCANDGLAVSPSMIPRAAVSLKSGRRTAFADVTAAFYGTVAGCDPRQKQIKYSLLGEDGNELSAAGKAMFALEGEKVVVYTDLEYA